MKSSTTTFLIAFFAVGLVLRSKKPEHVHPRHQLSDPTSKRPMNQIMNTLGIPDRTKPKPPANAKQHLG